IRRKLDVTATPRDKAIEPGMETMVDVELRDADGKTVQGGEVAVVVVDEAVLALSNYRLADPLHSFYSPRGDDVSNHHLREKVLLAKSDALISHLRRDVQVSARAILTLGSSNSKGGGQGIGNGMGPPKPLPTPARRAVYDFKSARIV